MYNTVISPSSDEGSLILKIGQKLSCEASGSGSKTYNWRCGQENFYSGSSVTVSDGVEVISGVPEVY